MVWLIPYNRESRAHAISVGRAVAADKAVAVDIREMRHGHDRAQPPVRTRCNEIGSLLEEFDLAFVNACLIAGMRRPHVASVHHNLVHEVNV